MAEPRITEKHLAGLLQAARDFAFEQMARDGMLIPFAARVEPSGEINFARYAEPGTSEPLETICERTMKIMASAAAGGADVASPPAGGPDAASPPAGGAIIAAAVVSAVVLEGGAPGFVRGLRIHIEAPGLCREVLVPYAPGRQADGTGTPGLTPGGLTPGGLRLGAMISRQASAVIFPG